MVLEKIQKENDIKKLTPEELEQLKDEIRQFLIESISVTGGHCLLYTSPSPRD